MSLTARHDIRSCQNWAVGDVEVSVVMPCLNEAETLAVCIAKARGFFERSGVAGEVIVADNGSTDGSQQIAEAAGARVVHVADRGYGSALQGGIAAARGRYVIMGDADDSYDFANLGPFVEKLREGYDLVMGNRFRGGISPGAMPPLHKYLGNPVLSGIGRLFFRSPIGDFHCGLRGFSKEAYDRMEVRTTGMEFASEMVVKATLLHMRIAEVPTTLQPDGRSRPPHLRSWRDGWRHLRFLLLYSPRWLFLYPGAALMIVGLAVGGWLLPGPRFVAGIGFDAQTLLYAGLAVLIGYQAVIFAFFTKVFAMNAGLLPHDARVERVTKGLSLETGLIVGALLIVFGLAMSVFAVSVWARNAFGELDPSRTLRLIVPAGVALTLGCQTILSSFFLSVLSLRRR
ncbi:MAG TPA: glycosyltransferase family 2 protein [Thermoanaerobaculia bacterium]|nr:glycosyltransferase family 2 protein [Thermoanaerobaculia bacterium]